MDTKKLHELWCVVDELRRDNTEPCREDLCEDMYRAGQLDAATLFESTLTRLNIQRKRVCGECEAYRISDPDYTFGWCWPNIMPNVYSAVRVERSRDASRCPCFRVKEAPCVNTANK